MLSYDFSKGQWLSGDFMKVASVRVPYRLDFEQADACIHNEHADTLGDEYAYVSMVLRERVSAPCTISTECRFQTYGAPLLVLADAVDTLPDGRLQYGHHIEVVGWEKGINVWDLYPDDSSKDGQHTMSMGKFSFPVADNERFLLSATVRPDGKMSVGIRIGERCAEFECPARVSPFFYAGITACEGKNYFYNFSVNG